MPIMNGFEATEQIRAWEKNRGGHRTPIVALTANAMREDIEKTVKAGCDIHLSKPIRKARLMDVIKKFQAKSHSSQPDADPSAPVTTELSEPDVCHVNMETLARLRDDMGDNIGILIDKFLEKLPGRIQAIVDAVDQNSPERLSQSAHSLKGISSTFGAENLASIARQLEMIGKSGHIPEDGKFLAMVRAEGLEVDEKIRGFMHG
jgi:CheY-like chemotaxis protein